MVILIHPYYEGAGTWWTTSAIRLQVPRAENPSM